MAKIRGSFLAEWELWAALAVLIVTYVVRFEAFPLVGEETRYACVTREMFATGDWIVPRELGEPFNSRPPLIFWLMALPATWAGEVNIIAIRLASIIGVVLTGAVIYAYGRTLLSRTGALLAVLFWITMPELLIANRKAEAEALFTLSLASCLLAWHAAYARRWSATALWVVGYGLAGVATMVKGPQAPVYFALSTWLFLALRRDWRTLFNAGHAIGMGVFALIFCPWVVLYCWSEGIRGFIELWVHDSALRVHGQTMIVRFLTHLVTFPAEVFGCMLPWSFLLLPYLSPRFRSTPDTPAGHRMFLGLAAFIGFVPCWLTVGGVSRYFQPLYPLLVVLMAWAVEQLAANAVVERWWRLFWRVVSMAPVLLCLGLVAAIAATHGLIQAPLLQNWEQPVGMIVVLSLGGVVAACLLWRAAATPTLLGIAVLAYAGFLGLFATTAWVDAVRNRMVPLDADVARLKSTLPPGQPAHYLDYVHHRFVFYYGEPMSRLDKADLAHLQPGDCFCVTGGSELPAELKQFKVVSAFSMDRYRSPHPGQFVHVLQVGGDDRRAAVASASD